MVHGPKVTFGFRDSGFGVRDCGLSRYRYSVDAPSPKPESRIPKPERYFFDGPKTSNVNPSTQTVPLPVEEMPKERLSVVWGMSTIYSIFVQSFVPVRRLPVVSAFQASPLFGSLSWTTIHNSPLSAFSVFRYALKRTTVTYMNFPIGEKRKS